jgi:hypothetical protein
MHEINSTGESAMVVSLALFMLTAAVAAPVASPAPATSGVYLTAQDQANGTLTDAGSCQAQMKVALHDLRKTPFIDVSRGAEKKQYAKDAVFGVRLCDGYDYRLVASRLLRIVEAKALYVYVVERPVTQGKGFRLVPAYYFSSGARGDVLPLTLENLHRVYAANHRFIDSLDRVSEQDLAGYDALHQRFKIGHLLEESTTASEP